MKLVQNWGKVLTQAWSMRFLWLATALAAAELALPAFEGVLPPKTFAILSLVATFGAAIARLIAQPSLHAEDESPDA